MVRVQRLGKGLFWGNFVQPPTHPLLLCFDYVYEAVHFGCTIILSFKTLCSLNPPVTVDTVTPWLLVVKYYHQPFLLQGLFILTAISELSSVTASPAISPGLRREPHYTS